MSMSVDEAVRILKDASLCISIKTDFAEKEYCAEAIEILLAYASRPEPSVEELADIIIKVAMGHHDDVSKMDEDNAVDCATAILTKFRLPGKVDWPDVEMAERYIHYSNDEGIAYQEGQSDMRSACIAAFEKAKGEKA